MEKDIVDFFKYIPVYNAEGAEIVTSSKKLALLIWTSIGEHATKIRLIDKIKEVAALSVLSLNKDFLQEKKLEES